jgi:hypothetical protein
MNDIESPEWFSLKRESALLLEAIAAREGERRAGEMQVSCQTAKT